MRRRTKALITLACVVATAIAIVVTLGVVATESAWGRQQLARVISAQINGRLAAGVRFKMGRLNGGFGGAWSVDSVSLIDSAGRPVILVKRASADLSVSDLLRGDVKLRILVIEGLRAYLTQRRDGNWNVSYLVGPRSVIRGPAAARGIVTADSIAILDARMEMLSLDTNPALPLQKRVFSGINAIFGPTSISSRDSVGGWAPLRTLNLGIDTPPVKVVSGTGNLRWWSDSILLDVRSLRLPATRAAVHGVVAWPAKKPVSIALDVRADTVSTSDIGWMSPLIPHSGGGKAVVAVRSAVGGGMRYDISSFDLAAVSSRVSGSFSITPSRHTTLRDMAFDFAPLDLALIRDIFGDSILKPAWQGALTGRLRGRGGALDSLILDTIVASYDDARTRGAHSHFVGTGAIDVGTSGITRLLGLALHIDSLDVRTLGAISKSADSLHGVLAGRVILDGPTRNLNFHDLWMQHVDGDRGRSTFSGAGRVASDQKTQWLEAKLTLDTIAVATLARDRSSLPLRGMAHGALNATATRDTVTLDVAVQSGDASAHLAGTTLLDSTRTVMQLSGIVAKFDPRVFIARREIPAMLIGGALSLELDDTPTTVDHHVAIHLDSASRVGDSQVQSGVIRLGLDSDGFHMDTVDVRTAGWRIDARGRLARTGAGTNDSLTFAAEFDSLAVLRTLVLDSTGSPRFKEFEGKLRASNGVLRGSFESLALRTDIGVAALRVGGLGVRHGTATVALEGLPNHATGLIRGTVDSLAAGGASFDLASVAARIENGERMRLTASASTGDTIRASAGADITWPADEFLVRIDSLVASIAEHRWQLTAPANARISTGVTALDSLIMRSDHGALVGAYGSLPDRGVIDASLRVTSLGFEELAFLGLLPADVSGRLTALARISGTRDAPVISATAALDSIRSAEHDRPTLTFDGTYAQRVANVKLDATIGGRRVLEVKGDVPLDLSLREVKNRVIESPIALVLRADSLTLGDFEALVPSVTSLGGSLQGAVDVGGSLRHPTGRGTLLLRNGAFDLPTYGFAARNTEMLLELSGDSVLVKRLRMSDSDSPRDSAAIVGVVRLDGTNWNDWVVNLTSTASRFRVIDDPRLATAEASWDLSIKGELAAPRVTGAVRLPYGLFTIGAQKRARTPGRITTRRAGIPNLDGVTVTLGSDVRLKSRDANVQLTGDVELFGPLDKPWISGSVSATRGTYRVDLGVIKRTFRVDSGSVILEGTSDTPAALDIYASYTVRRADEDDIHIGAHVYGTSGKPRLDLSSDLGSATAQSEIISYLVFGQSTFGLDPGRQSTVRTATAALVPSLGGLLEGALGTLLPFFSTLQVSTVAGDGPQNVVANPLEGVLNSFAVTGGRQIGTDSFFSVSGGVCRGSHVSSTESAPFWTGASFEYRPKRTVGAAFTIDPGPAPCSRAGTLGDTYQLGLDLSYEWKFGKPKKR